MTRNYQCEVKNQTYSEKYARRHCADGERCGEDPSQGLCSVIDGANEIRAQSQPSRTPSWQELEDTTFTRLSWEGDFKAFSVYDRSEPFLGEDFTAFVG